MFQIRLILKPSIDNTTVTMIQKLQHLALVCPSHLNNMDGTWKSKGGGEEEEGQGGKRKGEFRGGKVRGDG